MFEDALEVLTVLHLGHKGATGLHIDVQVHCVTISVLVDTGSAVSILSSASYEKLRSSVSLQSSTAALFNLSRHRIPVQGFFLAPLAFNSREDLLLFYVVPEGTDILGLDAVVALQLQIDGGSLHCLHTCQGPDGLSANVTAKFSDLFDGKLGCAFFFFSCIK